jgi:hypothetical protein
MHYYVDIAAVSLSRAVAHPAHAASPTPTWAVVMSVGLGLVLTTAWVALALVSIRRPPGRQGDDDHGSGPGGGGPRRQGPDGDAPSGTPALWAEFERDFAAYVSKRTASLT